MTQSTQKSTKKQQLRQATADRVDPVYLSPRQAAERLPGRPDPWTVVRWITRGLKINGERVFLRGRRIGGRWFVSDIALGRFLDDACPDRAAHDGESRTPESRPGRLSARERRRRLRQANNVCEAFGL